LNSQKFFRKSDWLACWLTFAVSLLVYVLTLQPTLGLEDSGELCVASDYLGVPHPPGYPIWSLLTWFSQWVFHAVTFHGHPNPAWAVNLFSGVAGAAACGVLALLISRSGMDILRSMEKESVLMGEKTESMFCCVAGISAGLLLAFGQGMWSQAVIAEVYTLNIFFQTLILLFLYRWMAEPNRIGYLYLTAFTFGLGFTNHQTLMFMGAAIAIAILFRDFHLFRDFAISGVFFLVMLALNKHFAGTKWAWVEGPEKIGFWFWTAYCIIIPLIAGFTLKNGRTVCITYLVLFLGLAFYLYMPFSSDQNPPINWGYPRTWQGFMHAITRGQYERVKVAHVLENPAHFIHQCEAFFIDLRSQYLPLVLTGFLPFAAWKIRKFNAALVAIALFIIAASLFTLSTLIGIKIPEAAGIAHVLNQLANPFIIGLFLLFAMGFGMAVANFIELAIKKGVEIWKEGGFWRSFTVIILLGVGALALAANLYITVKLLKALFTQAGDHTAIENSIVFLWAILPPIFVVGSYFLKKAKATQLKFDISELGQHWFITTLVAFVATSIIFLIIWNPQTDIQNLFIGRVQFIQPHAIYAIWMGYGLLLMMAYVDSLLKNVSIVKYTIMAGILSLPLFLIVKNYVDPHQKKIVGGSEQNGHDFGWQFGNWQLQGVHGIEEDMRAWYSEEEFEKLWAEYPNKNYPEPMGTNAIFFGGTDPGRFVPTYMIYSAKVRSDVYLITQNALADNTYMNVMRDLYGDQIWIPSPLDSNQAFQEYVQGVQSGRINAGADVTTEGGKVQVQGVAGVMQINGFLSKMIFDHNQYRTETKTDEKTRPVGSAVVYEDPALDGNGKPPQRTFYVEESYVLPWMYPYLTPHGLIMKINNQPTPLTPEIVKNDTDFWKWYCGRLLNDEKFIRDIVARKSFSKLRSAIAGLYAARGRPEEAEAAFRQSVDLYDLSPEANFRLADLIAKQGRYDEAIELFDVFLKKDPNNEKGYAFKQNLISLKKMDARKTELQEKFRTGTIEFTEAVEMINILNNMGQVYQGDALAMQMINSGTMKPEMLMQLAQFMAQNRRFNIVEQAILKYTQMNPNDYQAWINLSALRLVMSKHNEMWQSLNKSIEIGGEQARMVLRKDARFDALRKHPQFLQIVPPLVPTQNTASPLKIPGL